MALIDHNVTVDPRASATPVDDPAISEIIDLVSGEVLDTRAFVSSRRYDDLIATRVEVKTALQAEAPRFVCAMCATPVYLIASVQKHFFFRHKAEDGSCPAITRGELTREDIQARKYHGLRESEAHKRIKRLLERSLQADSSFATEAIQTEGRWNSTADRGQWRRPDVQATSTEGKFAFEAQLSTTFLDVVASRRAFYQADGAYLVWVLAHFSPDYRRLTTDDLLFSNNSNVFVVDDETVQISEEKKRFHLRCHYREPFCEEETINERWSERIVAFAETRKDLARQRVFYFDFEAEEQRCRDLAVNGLRQAILDYWRDVMTSHARLTGDQIARWRDFRAQLQARSVEIPEYPAGDGAFRNLMHAVLSGLFGRAVGWNFDSLIQCAHHVASSHPENLLPFGFAVELSGNKPLLESQDTSGKWAARREAIRAHIAARDPKFLPDAKWLPALKFLFPDIGRKITDLIS
jgi:competence CoiA-like predicted nuclease